MFFCGWVCPSDISEMRFLFILVCNGSKFFVGFMGACSVDVGVNRRVYFEEGRHLTAIGPC